MLYAKNKTTCQFKLRNPAQFDCPRQCIFLNGLEILGVSFETREAKIMLYTFHDQDTDILTDRLVN